MKANGHAREPADERLTTEQATVIVMLMQRIGIDADSSSMLEAQRRCGGPATPPNGYLMLTRPQATRLLEMMTAFSGESRSRAESRSRDGDARVTATDVELKAVEVSMAPPRRLMQDGRFRTFKTRDDKTLWHDLLAPVEALIEDGWQVVGVLIAWGQSIPLAQAAREKQARLLTLCASDVCTYGEEPGIDSARGAYGRGQTTFTLERER